MKKISLFIFQLFALFSSLAVLSSCDGSTEVVYIEDTYEYNFAPFYVSSDRSSATLDGVIDSNSLLQFSRMLYQHPGIEVIIFDQAPGSLDDVVNYEIGRIISDLNIDTHIADNGIIASGAVDLFLAGRFRTRGFNTAVAVQSWSDSFGIQGSDYPQNSSVHDFYLNYYLSIGMGPQLANDFYFFSINAADSDELYFMDESEIQFYLIFS